MFSYHWQKCSVPAELQPMVDVLGNVESPLEDELAAMRAMLASDSTTARCMALDLFTMGAGQRQGTNTLSEALYHEARAAALRELAAPPSEIPGSSPSRGANHASAMYAMWHVSQPEDGPLLARALAANDDDAVHMAGIGAAEPMIRCARRPDPELVAFLRGYLQRPDADPRTQGSALQALTGRLGAAVEALLVESLAHPTLDVASNAAWTLLLRKYEVYRQRVAPLLATWPPRGEVAPFAVYEVRRMIEDGFDPAIDYETVEWDDDTGTRVDDDSDATDDGGGDD